MLDTFNLTVVLLQQTCVYLVIAYLLTKTPLFVPLVHVTIRLPYRIASYLVFSMFCIMGIYFSQRIGDSIANTRAIGAVMGGLLGGPWVGFAVGLTGGLHRYSLGGFTALACAISTITEGLIGGFAHSLLIRRDRLDRVFHPLTAGIVTFLAEVTQMAIILAVARPFADALTLVKFIAMPMITANTLGAALFMRILIDRRTITETESSVFSAKALKIAARADGVLRSGFNEENSMTVARILYEETGVGAVAITIATRFWPSSASAATIIGSASRSPRR